MKESLNLLLGLFERVPDRRRRRGAHLELRDHAVDPFGVGIDGPAVVAAHADREGDVEDVLGHVVPKLAEAVLRFGRAGRMRLPRVRFERLVIDHGPSMTKSHPWKFNLGSELAAYDATDASRHTEATPPVPRSSRVCLVGLSNRLRQRPGREVLA